MTGQGDKGGQEDSGWVGLTHQYGNTERPDCADSLKSTFSETQNVIAHLRDGVISPRLEKTRRSLFVLQLWAAPGAGLHRPDRRNLR